MRRLLVLFLLLFLPLAAAAQLRTIPQEAKRGKIRHLQEVLVQIDGKQQRLSPGAQIRDGANRVILPTAIPAGALVKYEFDAQGLVRRIWILTSEEAGK